jgi:hypothetical protein
LVLVNKHERVRICSRYHAGEIGALRYSFLNSRVFEIRHTVCRVLPRSRGSPAERTRWSRVKPATVMYALCGRHCKGGSYAQKRSSDAKITRNNARNNAKITRGFPAHALYTGRPKPPPEHEIRRPTRRSSSQAWPKLRRIIQQQKAEFERTERKL